MRRQSAGIPRQLLFATACAAIFTQAGFAGSSYRVKYISAESVYLDGGTARGLAVGDRLQLVTRRGCSVEIEVLFTAEHSAACQLQADTCVVMVGDSAVLISKIEDVVQAVDSVEPVSVKPDTVDVPPPGSSESKRPRLAPKLTGSASTVFYYLNDQAATNLDFMQSTARLDLKVRRLFGQGLTLSLRSRGRYDDRGEAYGPRLSGGAWENRIWEFSLAYDDPTARVNAYGGRFVPKHAGNIGYLDGLLVEVRLRPSLVVGLFSGADPDWAFSDQLVSLNRGGMYVSLTMDRSGRRYLQQSIAAVGEYHGGTVSRELLSIQGRWMPGNRWSLTHLVEMEINRGWRKEKTNQTLSLTSLYATTSYQATQQVRLGLGYDNRTNIWTLTNRSTADSLFDDHQRQGVRSHVDLSLPYRIRTSLSFGLRKREGDPDPTLSSTIYVSKIGLFDQTSSLSLQYALFDGPFENGANGAARVGYRVMRDLRVGLGYGAYRYRSIAQAIYRSNAWLEFSMQGDLSHHCFVGGTLQRDSGDDLEGIRITSELGYRF